MDSKNTYKDKMDQIQPPNYLKEKVLQEMHMLTGEEPATGNGIPVTGQR